MLASHSSARARGTLLCLALLVLTATAEAHEPPFISQIAWDDASGELLLWTNRGLIFADPARGEYRLLCNQALGVNSGEQPDFIETSTGALLFGTAGGLLRSEDGGCSFSGVAPFETTPIYALQRDPESSERLVLVDAADNRAVYESLDEGATFAPLFALEDDVFYEELAFAPSAAGRLYAAGLVLGTPFTHFVALSEDGGSSWERREVALLENEGDITLLDVGPTDADALLVKAHDDTSALADRLLISRDGGLSFSSPLTVTELHSARFAADGGAVYVTGSEGMWVSRDGGASFDKLPDAARMSLALEHDDALYASGYFRGVDEGRDGLARSLDGGESFEPVMLFTDVAAPVACGEATETAVACQLWWQDWLRELDPSAGAGATGGSAGAGGQPPTAGAGAGAAGGVAAGTGVAATPGNGDGCGCRVAGASVPGKSRSGPASGLLGAALGAALALRRRRHATSL